MLSQGSDTGEQSIQSSNARCSQVDNLEKRIAHTIAHPPKWKTSLDTISIVAIAFASGRSTPTPNIAIVRNIDDPKQNPGRKEFQIASRRE